MSSSDEEETIGLLKIPNINDEEDLLNDENPQFLIKQEILQETPEETRSATCVVSSLKTFLWTLFFFLTSNYTNFLLGLIPFTFMSFFIDWGDVTNFVLSLLTLVPLSWQLIWLSTQVQGYFYSEEMSTFSKVMLSTTQFLLGNGSEMIIGIVLLYHGKVHIVQSLVIGSILSRHVLSMGLCFIIHSSQSESSALSKDTPYTTLGSMLLLALFSIFIPGWFQFANIGSQEGVLRLTRWISSMLIPFSIVYLVFMVKTQKLFTIESEYKEKHKIRIIPTCILLLIIIFTICVESFLLSKTVESMTLSWGFSQSFTGTILIPMITQAGSQMTYTRYTFHKSIISSLQISFIHSLSLVLFVTPLFTLFSWLFTTINNNIDPFSFSFTFFQMLCAFSAVVYQKMIILDKEVMWFNGVLMVAVYFIVALSFFYHL